jgi:hypothetical protein
VINNDISEEINDFNYLGYAITATNSKDLGMKFNRFNPMSKAISRKPNNKIRDTGAVS